MDNTPLPSKREARRRKGGFNAGINIRRAQPLQACTSFPVVVVFHQGGWVAISLSLSPRDDEGARGGSPDRCVCPRPPRVTQLLLTLLPSGGSYTNFQECLPPHPSATLESPFPGSPFSFSTHLPAPAPRVSIATWRRVFAYYTLCVTEADSLCMPARLCMWIYIYVYVSVYAGMRGGAFRGNGARVSHTWWWRWWWKVAKESGGGVSRGRWGIVTSDGKLEEGGGRGRGGGRGARVCRFFVLCRVAAIPHTPAFHLGSELIPPRSSRVGGSPRLPPSTPSRSLALPLSPWNFYESVLSLYIYMCGENGWADDALWFLPGLSFLGTASFPLGGWGWGGGEGGFDFSRGSKERLVS